MQTSITRLIVFAVGLAPLISYAQPSLELDPNTHLAVPYPATWPNGPGPAMVPAWAKPGTIRFARWDGGRIETAKGFLTAWPGLNPPDPDIVYTLTNWYDLRTIAYLKQADINLIWVTFSVGFSDETEKAHQAQVRAYIAECHRQGIHVLAYESIANLFREDMFSRVPVSESWISHAPDGKPIPYPSGDYKLLGRVTRYMADLTNPGWRNFLLHRVDLAMDAGADGIAYDNNYGGSLWQLYQDIMAHAARRNAQFLIMANFHSDTYSLNRLINCITTEDGVEPGLYSSTSEGFPDLADHRPFLLPVGPHFLVNNFGLLRIQETLSGGWKPVMVEDGRREHAFRMCGFMAPDRIRLALAENMSFGIALEQFVEETPALGLAKQDPKAEETWNAVGQYNRFFDAHPELCVGLHSQSDLAVVMDDRSQGVPLLDGLAARHVPFEILYERDLTALRLANYKAVALLSCRVVRSTALTALEGFVHKGGKLIVSGRSGELDENGHTRPRPAFFDGKTADNATVEELAAGLRDAIGPLPFWINAPDGVLWNQRLSADGKSIVIHVLNYTLREITGATLRTTGDFRSARIVSPDGPQGYVPLANSAAAREYALPALGIYSAIVLDR